MNKEKALSNIALATDVSSKQEALDIVLPYRNKVNVVKTGLELFTATGYEAVDSIQSLGFKIFLDLKLNDIPNTVNKAVRNMSKRGICMTTVHALGGSEMMKAAVRGAEEGAKNTIFSPTIIIGVTILTSLDAEAMYQIGLIGKPEMELIRGADNDVDLRRTADKIMGSCVNRLAALAVDSGARAIVCSAKEVKNVRETVGSDILLIVPGTRLPGSDHRDQVRVGTPGRALKDGGENTMLVISSERNRLSEIVNDIIAAA